MRFQSLLLSLVTFATARRPWERLSQHKRDVVIGQTCDQYGHFETSTYTLYNNLWGKDFGSGQQCTTLQSDLPEQNGEEPESISWTTEWNWSKAASQVKSYANVVLKPSGIKQVSEYTDVPVYWEFNYTGSNFVADVAFDIFTSSGPSGTFNYEIMLWLGKYGGAAPISSAGQPIAINLSFAGKVFDLYEGMNKSMKVYTFVMHGAERTSVKFRGDLVEVFTWLVDHKLLDGSQYLRQIGAGTETFMGDNCLFTTQKYWITAT